MMNESLLYSAADAMQIPLYPFAAGYLGKSRQIVKIGPWSFQMEPAALSDALTLDAASFFMHVRKNLWVYFVASNGKTHPVHAYVVDGSMVGLTVEKLKDFGTGKVKDTLDKLKKGIVYTYAFSTDTQKWEEAN